MLIATVPDFADFADFADGTDGARAPLPQPQKRAIHFVEPFIVRAGEHGMYARTHARVCMHTHHHPLCGVIPLFGPVSVMRCGRRTTASECASRMSH